jgi:hypothetical protein
MARIVIKDLKANVELDREAMRQITGGRSGQHLNLNKLNQGTLTYESNLFKKQPHLATLGSALFDFDPNWR